MSSTPPQAPESAPADAAMNEKPKRCPFCGHTADLAEDCDRLARPWTVFCERCDSSTAHCETLDEAISNWNARQQESAAAPATSESAEATPCSVCNALIVGRNATRYDAEDLAAAKVRAKIIHAGLNVEPATPEGAAPGGQGRLFNAAYAVLEMCNFHGDFRNGVTDPTGSIDEGNVRAGELLGELRAALQAEPQAAQGVEPVAWWIPEAEQFAVREDGSRPFAKVWEPLYATPQAAPEHKARAYVDGNDMVRELRWMPDMPSFDLPVGTKLYAEPQAAPQASALSDATRVKLHAFLDAAGGEGIVLDGIDGGDLYAEVFPDEYAAALAASSAAQEDRS